MVIQSLRCLAMVAPSMTSSLIARRTALAVAAAAVLQLASTIPASATTIEAKFSKLGTTTTTAVDHTVWDNQLKAYVKPDATGLNLVDYKRWKAEGHTALKGYVAQLQASDPAKLSRDDAFAFWSNLYNARTVDIVLDKYPVKSIKDISLGGGLKALVGGGPWQANTMKVSGLDLSLDDVEHKILRAYFKDPRVHYALNCASDGCPNLAMEAYTGAKLEAQLEAGAKAFINHPRGIAADGGKVKASQIYNWFIADFGGSADKVLDHVRKYAEPALKAKLNGITTIASHDYLWSLNDIRK
jgi:hypothetical protein